MPTLLVMIQNKQRNTLRATQTCKNDETKNNLISSDKGSYEIKNETKIIIPAWLEKLDVCESKDTRENCG